MSQNSLYTIQIRISGDAGDGITTASEILLSSAASYGLEGYVIKNIPSTIEGGYTETIIVLSIEKREVFFSNKDDIMIILSENAIKRNKNSIGKSELVFIEENIEEILYKKDIENNKIIKVPLRKLSYQVTGSYRYISALIVGIVGSIVNFDKETVKFYLKNIIDKKNSKTLESNIKVFEAGIEWLENNLPDFEDYHLTKLIKKSDKEVAVLDGNEMIALGAIKAGCKFYSSYPITPATLIGECLTEILPVLNGVAYQAEDEIAAIGAVIGASFFGVKAMTATSGPGLSLMQEFIGYASMAEIPVVIVDVQRAGPSTGMPTKYAQEDLLSAIWGGHGENQRIVLSPVNIEDCFYIMLDAFHLAYNFRCPVIVLSDVSIATTKKVIEKLVFKNDYIPYPDNFCQDKREEYFSFPTTSSCCVTGIEHNDYFLPVDTPEERISQIEKRNKKLLDIEEKIKNSYELDMDPVEEGKICIAIACWGGLVSHTKQAVKSLRQKGYLIAAFYPRLLYPICKKGLDKWCSYSSLKIVVEANSLAQYSLLLKTIVGIDLYTIRYYGGEQPSYLEIIEEIEQIVSNDRL